MLILLKVAMVIYINLANSVIDSDATHPLGYMALAKKLHAGVAPTQVLAGQPIDSPWGPSVLAAWPHRFLDRWHDSVAGLPWLFAYLTSIGTAFEVCRRAVGTLTPSPVCAYAFSALPLMIMQAIRIGFNDMLTAYFFTMAIGAVGLLFMKKWEQGELWTTIGLVAIAGSALTKMEGKMWAVCLAVFWISHYAHTRKGISWMRILSIQGVAAGVLLLWHQTAGDVFAKLAPSRLELLVPAPIDPAAVAMSLNLLFSWGTFNVWWWLFFSLCLSLFIMRADPDVKVFAGYGCIIVACVFYFANCTENVQFTLIGTNFGRFLLQVTGLLLPVYCAYWLRMRPRLEGHE